MADPLSAVRHLGVLVEHVHASVYFAHEPQAEYAALGLRGYWRGYFASRLAALGPVGPGVATAVLAGFAPRMVARAVPGVWSIASPAEVTAARQRGALAALRRLVGSGHEDGVAAAADLTSRCAAALPLPGRPMAAAHADLVAPAGPLALLWHNCTVLREHRGDAHLAAVAVAGLTWPEPHLLHAPVDPRLREHRGWTEQEWVEAAHRVGSADSRDLQAATDRLAAPAYAPLAEQERLRLREALEPLARACANGIPFPNAMGLPPLR